jgi:hypothetical protein
VTQGCPSELRLEAHLLDRSASGLSPHLDACPDCQARVSRMEAEGEDFRRFVYPATVDAVVEAAAPRVRRNWFAFLVPSAAAAAAGLLLLVAPVPPDGYVGLKGEALGLTVFVGTPDGARAVADGGSIPASAALRFQVRSASPCRLWIVSVDAGGQISRLYPPWGDEGADVAVGGPLPGGAVLDGKPGPERVFAVCSPRPIRLDVLEAAGRAVAAQGSEGVRRTRELGGLPTGVVQASLLLEKGE